MTDEVEVLDHLHTVIEDSPTFKDPPPYTSEADLMEAVGELIKLFTVVREQRNSYRGLLERALAELSDPSDCPYFQDAATGTCASGCHEEPACITDRPRDGWPKERIQNAMLATEGHQPATAPDRHLGWAEWTGAGRIAAERRRQIEEEGWSLERDVDLYPRGELAAAAVCYAVEPRVRETESFSRPDGIPYLWPWHSDWWKPSPDDRVRELEKAGALIAAEIDRIQRLKEGAQ